VEQQNRKHELAQQGTAQRQDSPAGNPSSVRASLTYTLHLPEKLIYLITEMGEDEDSPEYHKWYDVHDVTIENARSGLKDLSLDREGFVLRQAQTAVTDFYDNAQVRDRYEGEVKDLIEDITGADEVVVFDHTIRVESDRLRRERHVREIVNLVHNDYTVRSGPQRVRDLLGDEKAEEYLAGRFAIFNLWRSIAGTVFSTPLALCEAQSVKPEDWVEAGLDYGDRMGEIYNTAYNPDHRWRYFPAMTADEVLVFKNFDSATDGRARFTPHTAFVDPTSPPDAPPRESIETRALAFFSS